MIVLAHGQGLGATTPIALVSPDTLLSDGFVTLILRRTPTDLGLQFLGVSLKLQRSRIAVENNG
jgi:hypothetical protein